MSFYGEDLDPRDARIYCLQLANINTPDGDFGFIVGADGVFEDITGKRWVGSQLIRPGDDEFAIDGVAPTGSLALSFFQDPDAPDLVAQVRALGSQYIQGRKIQFFVQPGREIADFYAPKVAPRPVMTRIMRRIIYNLNDAQDRSLTLTYESAFEGRRTSRRLVYNETDHGLLIGARDPSLRQIPTQNFQEEPLFG
ncbi:hypothetical protein P775_14275 [Puniceibacterium antarcticum]|uniref:Uncharacterized protein n=1 Tax=Puniceibacterium antarcticum TaxID=1206336 RepID=A0A2G8RD57_9RHOB|nr:hypothetical protein [Puniceibacterium antarcticum]PIL19516.1 hypothetical protein P775_14275 [Puniceibacterium antarcticum]